MFIAPRTCMLLLALALTIFGASTEPALAQSARVGDSVYRVEAISRYAGPQQAQGRQGNDPNVEGAGGTGFLVSGRRIVLTNNHVVSAFREVNGQRVLPLETTYRILILRSGQPTAVPARLVATLPEKDLAILEASEDLPGTPLTIADFAPDRDLDVEALGFPGIADRTIQAGRGNMTGVDPALLQPFKTQGRVQRVFNVTDLRIGGSPANLTTRVVQHTAAFSGGNSGGPLVNRCDQVVGINTYDWADQRGARAHQSVASVEATQFLRARNIQFASASRFCFLPGGVRDNLTLGTILGILSAMLGTTALILAARKPQVIRETVRNVSNSFSKLSRRADGGHQIGSPPVSPAADHRPPEPRRDDRPPAPRAGEAMVKLVPLAGGESVEILVRRLSSGRTAVIGRSRETIEEHGANDHPVVLADKSVSRRHARLAIDEASRRLRVEDLGSTAGTFRNDQKIDQATFANGDTVKFGTVAYRVVLPG